MENSKKQFFLQIDSVDHKARTGVLHTAHGSIMTPAFMPVGTSGTVKGMTVDMLESSGVQIILGNTYHLMLRPGENLIDNLGGLRVMMRWKGPILTDSGGYQIMSLAKLRTVHDKGVIFRSHIDGSEHELTPEKAIQIQHKLDSTVTMVLDECTSYPVTKTHAKESMNLSMRWAERSYESYIDRNGYGLFGIVQGGVYSELREQSAKYLVSIGFDGYALGGLAVGEGQKAMLEVTKNSIQFLPFEKPRYLMGVGKPLDIIRAVIQGIDLFDCVLPTRSGRTGQAFTRYGTVNLKNSRHRNDHRPLDESVNCEASLKYSRAYLHHLVKSGEVLGLILLSWHNIAFYQQLMSSLRQAIKMKSLYEFEENFRRDWEMGDIEQI